MTAIYPDDDVIKPSSNLVQETIRLMPNGVKLYLIGLPPRDRITGIPPVVKTWLEERDLIGSRGKRYEKKHLRLTEHGISVQKALLAKFGGRNA